MKSALECLPCFLKQSLYTARLSCQDSGCHTAIMRQCAQLIAAMDLELSPPENAMAIYAAISAQSESPDPFYDLKKESNHFAATFLADNKKIVTQAKDPLLTSILFAIAGNIIDYGSQQDFDAMTTLQHCLTTPLVINHYPEFLRHWQNSQKILYLADNAGEIVFDRLVIETMLTIDQTKEIIVAVKDGPIINDALVADAKTAGLDDLCQIISTGVCCPGTPLRQCSQQFQHTFANADLIISKGQGNFETLSLVPGPIFFLLTIKCAIVASHLAELVNSYVAQPEPGTMKDSQQETAQNDQGFHVNQTINLGDMILFGRDASAL